MLGLLLAACGSGERPPHVLLITMDTLRADALGCYGAAGDASPALDAFAAGATRYRRCVATAPWTVPSHASLFTGLFPFEHGAISFDVDRLADNVTPLAPAHWTLAEALQAEGYRSAGFVANAVYLNPRYGLSQGFETWDVAREQGTQLTRRALDWLDGALEEDPERPCFLFLNYLDTHRPYNVTPRGSEREYETTEHPSILLDRLIETVMVRGEHDAALEALVREQYARAVRNLDQAVGELLDGLRARGLFDDCVIVLTSDHGEYFGEHGLVEHSKDVYEEALEVPLLVRSPGQREGQELATRASLVDVPALVLERLPEPLRARRRAGFPRLPGEHAVMAENHFSRPNDLLRPEYQGRFRRERVALYTERFQYIHSSDGRHELRSLQDDSGQDCILEEPELARRLGQQLERALEAGRWRGAAGAAGPIDAEHGAAMRALGYLGSEDGEGE